MLAELSAFIASLIYRTDRIPILLATSHLLVAESRRFDIGCQKLIVTKDAVILCVRLQGCAPRRVPRC